MLELVGLEVPEAVRERVAEEMVELVPADGETEAEALETALLMEAEADEAAEEAADEAEECAEETADEAVPDPPVRGNWPE